MKTIKLMAILAFLLTGFVSCTKDYSEDYNNNGGSPQTTTAIVTQGSWRITYISDNGLDNTANFSGYTFTFNATGTVVASNAGVSTTGSWNTVLNGNQNTFTLSFEGAAAPLNALKDQWNIFETTTARIRMQIERSAGRVDYLTIEKAS